MKKKKGSGYLSIDEIFKKVDEKEDRLIEIFRNVIGIDTTVPPGLNYDKIVNTWKWNLEN